MRCTARTVLPWLLLTLLLAGCSAPAQESDRATTTTTTTPTQLVRDGFLVQDLRIAAGSGGARDLHEDDQAVVTYTLLNPDTEGNHSDFLVSYLLNGQVEDVTTVRLAPGERKPFEHRMEDLRDVERIQVEVRAGSERATAEATVSEWPRTTDRVDLGPIAVTVNRWLKNETDGGTDVNVTVERKAAPDGQYSQLRARALCVDERGNVTTAGEERPNVPDLGMAAMTDIGLPGCPDIIYGLEVEGRDARGDEIYTRILFVERGWRPPLLPGR